VVTASADGSARVWNTQTGASICELVAGRTSVNSAAFNPSGDRVVTAHEDGSAAIWNAVTGALVFRLQHARSSDVLRGDFSPDGRSVLTASDSGTAVVWDATSGHERAKLNMRDEGVHAVFSPDGQLVVSASEAIYIPPTVWSSRDGAVRSHLSRAGGGILNVFAFSPNGACLASGGFSGKLTLSQPVTGRAFAESHRFIGGISSVAFAPDGRSLAVGSTRGSVYVLGTVICGDLDGLLQLARSKVLRSLTADERRAYLN
jgi:WD40 repeat protein